MGEDGQRHAPQSLARDAPIWTRGYHIAQAFLTLRWKELDLFYLGKCFFSQALCFATRSPIHADKPLASVAED